MKMSAMLAVKFELNLSKSPIWVWLELCLTPEGYFLNRICSITSLYSGKKPVQVERLERLAEIQPKKWKSPLYYFFKCTLKDTLTSKNSSVLS